MCQGCRSRVKKTLQEIVEDVISGCLGVHKQYTLGQLGNHLRNNNQDATRLDEIAVTLTGGNRRISLLDMIYINSTVDYPLSDSRAFSFHEASRNPNNTTAVYFTVDWNSGRAHIHPHASDHLVARRRRTLELRTAAQKCKEDGAKAERSMHQRLKQAVIEKLLERLQDYDPPCDRLEEGAVLETLLPSDRHWQEFTAEDLQGHDLATLLAATNLIGLVELPI